MTIQKYDWVSKDTKLNANGWNVPLRNLVSQKNPLTIVKNYSSLSKIKVVPIKNHLTIGLMCCYMLFGA